MILNPSEAPSLDIDDLIPAGVGLDPGYRMYRVDLLRRGYERWGEALLGEPSFACMPDLLLKLSVFRPSIGEAGG